MNINKALASPSAHDIRFTDAEATIGGGWFNKWILPSCTWPHKLDLSHATATVACHSDVRMYNRVRHKEYYQWFGSILSHNVIAPVSPCTWDHWPFMFGYRRIEPTLPDEKWVLNVWSFNDQDKFPLVILIARNGLIVPSIKVEGHTPIKVVFLSQQLDGFAFGHPGALLGLQFLEGRCGVNTDDAKRYRDRLNRFTKGANKD